MDEITFSVPGMSCDHCKHAFSGELAKVDSRLDDAALRAAIDEAGYEAAANQEPR